MPSHPKRLDWCIVDGISEDIVSEEPSVTGDAQPMPAATADPVTLQERVLYIDILRGMALFGILTANMRGFTAPLAVYFGGINKLFPSHIDVVVQTLVMILVQKKFVTLFSFLFGIGFAAQMSRAEARGVRFLSFYPRRLLALALFGLIHGIAIWAGDILLTYSISGALLLLFRKRKQKTVLRWAGGILIGPVLVISGMFIAAGMGWYHPRPRTPGPDVEKARQIIETYSHGSLLQIIHQNWTGWVDELRSQIFSIFALSLFLLGLWVWRSGMVQNLGDFKPVLKRVCAVCIPVGLVLNAAENLIPMWRPLPLDQPTFRGWLVSVLSIWAAPVLSAGYAAGLAVLIQNPDWKRRLTPFAAVGRTALTNYLAQSVICTVFFFATGLYGKLGPAWDLVPTLALYGAQLAVSNWWLARYRFGPMEWIWRGLTYGHLPVLRKSATGE